MAKRYGLTMTHPPNICPIANKASCEIAMSMWKQLPALTEKHWIKMLSLDHFDPEHLVIGIFEAENVESINNFAMEAGLMAWNDLKVNVLTPAATLMDNMDQAPPTIFF